MLSSSDKKILRDLAYQVNEITLNPKWDEKRELWRKKNSLEKTRPLVLCSQPDEVWPEFVPRQSLQVEDKLFKEYEWYLRRRLYQNQYLPDDEIIHRKLYVPIIYSFSDWIQGRKRPYSGDGKRAKIRGQNRSSLRFRRRRGRRNLVPDHRGRYRPQHNHLR